MEDIYVTRLLIYTKLLGNFESKYFELKSKKKGKK